MPNRILRDWTDSFTMDELDAHAERFFVRLIMKVDDFGCFHADSRLLKANLFPLKADVRDTDISRWIAACEKAGLITIYNVAMKEYLQIVNFNQRLRQKQNKFPLPNECSSGERQATNTSQANDGQVAVNSPPETKRSRNEVETSVEGENFRAPDLGQSNLFRKPVIPTKQQVWEAFSNAGGTKEMAKVFWERSESTGWFFRGSPITNFRHLVGSFIENWKKNDSKNSKSEVNAVSGAGQKIKDEDGQSIIAARRGKGTTAGA